MSTSGIRFPSCETGERLEELLLLNSEAPPLNPPLLGWEFAQNLRGESVQLRPSRLFLHADLERPLAPDRFLELLEEGFPDHILLLIQAGQTAMGFWKGGELVHHKVIRKYVVRGKGRAQPLHLKTRGKSRYGSRLRLREAQDQLLETVALLSAWLEESTEVPAVHYSCPVRLWADLFRTDPPPSLPKSEAFRIPHHVHRPNHAELLRVHRLLSQGELILLD